MSNNEQSLSKLLTAIAAIIAAGYGVSEIGKDKNMQDTLNQAKTAVESVVKDPTNIFKEQQQTLSKKPKAEELLLNPLPYDLTEERINFCAYYSDFCTEYKLVKLTNKEGEENEQNEQKIGK